MNGTLPGRTYVVAHAATVLLAGAVIASCGGDDSPTAPSGAIFGSGFVVVQDRAVGAFTGLNFASEGNVHIVQGGSAALRIEAEDNLMPHLRTQLNAGVLRIFTTSGVDLRPTRPIDFYMTAATLDSVVLAGVGNIEASDFDVDHLSLTLAGVGDLVFSDLEADELTATVAGVGDVIVSGEAPNLVVAVAGVGDFDGTDLQTLEANVQISGMGSATVRVRDRLVVTISGSGNVYCIGNPTVIATITGTGRVIQIGG